MAFGPSPFQCRLFHGRDALQNALARSPGPAVMKERPALPASAPDLGRTVKQTSTHPIGDRGPLPGRPEGPSILGQAAIYWTLPRLSPVVSCGPMRIKQADQLGPAAAIVPKLEFGR